MSDAPPFPESLVERYQALRVLGAGGFGTVYLAEDRRVERRVAIKLLHVDDDEVRARFQREARVTAALEHPHVVRVFDSGLTVEGTAYIAYEYVEGPDLSAALERRSLSAEEVIRLGVALADALHQAHERGVVHRDVKPANVLLRGGRAPVLTDFGIARVAAGETMVTADGMILGTPAFLAPECFSGAPPSAASDQFALAATLVEALTGAGVYPGDNLAEVLEALKVTRPTRFPAAHRGRFGPLEGILARAVSSAPEDRYPSCRAFGHALSEAWKDVSDGGLPVVGTPTVMLAAAIELDPTPVKGVAPARPRSRLAWRAAALFLVGLGAGWWGLRSREAPGPPPLPVSSRPDPEKVARLAKRTRDLDEAERALRLLLPESIPAKGDHSREFAVKHAAALVSSEVVESYRQYAQALSRWIEAVEGSADPRAPSPFSTSGASEDLGRRNQLLFRIETMQDYLTESGASHFHGAGAFGMVLEAQRAVNQAHQSQQSLVVTILDLPRRPVPEVLLQIAGDYARWAPLDLRVEVAQALARELSTETLEPGSAFSLLMKAKNLLKSIASDRSLGERRCQAIADLDMDLIGSLGRLSEDPEKVNQGTAGIAILEAVLLLEARCHLPLAPTTERRLLEEVVRRLRMVVPSADRRSSPSESERRILAYLQGRPEAVDVRLKALRVEVIHLLGNT